MTIVKYLGFALAGLFTVIVLYFAWLSISSRSKAVNLGLVNQRLQPCPQTPNCKCSEWPEHAAYIDGFAYDDAAQKAWQRLKTSIDLAGGTITKETDHYIAATFTTTLFRFIDDVEFRLDETNHRIHVRSASRVGRSDFGKNRERVEMLRETFKARNGYTNKPPTLSTDN